MKRTLTSIAALLLGSTALAHDFWLEPKTFGPEPGSILPVHVVVGSGLERSPFLREEEHIKRFVLVGPGGEKPLVGRPGDDPAGYVRLDQLGFLIVGYRSNPARIDLEAEKFTAYLREEGLESVIEERDERGEALAAGRESYSRCAKAVLTVGPRPSEGFDRRLGFDLEIVPEVDPTHLARRDGTSTFEPLSVRVFHGEQGAAGILVGARNLDDPSVTLHVRADEEGRARLELPCAGRWLVKAVHMERAPAGSDHEWSSLWASLTFDLEPSPTAPVNDPGTAIGGSAH
jgi:uncharacterized GH25 family protein